jgi:hypothetical protein
MKYNHTAEQLNKHIDSFTKIYVNENEDNPMPDNNVKLTVYYEGDYEGVYENGFL